MIYLTYHQAQAVAERAARVRKAAKHRGGYITGRERVVVEVGNAYYQEKNPELHGLYLTVERIGGSPVPLFAKDLGYKRDFAVERLGMRDEDGHVQHPDMDGIGWDEFDMGPQLRAIGWHSTTVSFESDASDEAQARYDEGNSSDCSYWTPSRPHGEGWLLAAIYDTEDGPVALYVRDADGVTVGASAEGTHLCTCNQYPHAPTCGVTGAHGETFSRPDADDGNPAP